MCLDDWCKGVTKVLLKSGPQEPCSGVLTHFGPSEELAGGGHRRAVLCV